LKQQAFVLVCTIFAFWKKTLHFSHSSPSLRCTCKKGYRPRIHHLSDPAS
jgi:hypothetical protein